MTECKAETQPCDEDGCQACCGEYVGHEHDTEEGMMCINCGKEWDGP